MIETYLQNIATTENGNYSCEQLQVAFPDGSKRLQSAHKLQFQYDDSVIEILLEIVFVFLRKYNLFLCLKYFKTTVLKIQFIDFQFR